MKTPDSSTPQRLASKNVSISVKTNSVILIATLLLIGILWGATIPLAKVAVSSGHAPLGITFWEQVIVAVVLGVVLIIRSIILRRRLRVPLDRDSIVYYSTIAALGAVLPNLFSYWAMSQLPAGIMAIIVSSVPMFALAIAIAASIERLVPYRVLGVCLGCAAIIILVAPDASLPDPEKAIFVLVGLVAPFCYGLEGNYIARFTPPEAEPIITLFCAAIIGSLVTAPLALATGAWIDMFEAFTSSEQAIFGLSVIHAAAYAGYIWLIGKAGPVFSSQVAYIITISAMFLSAIFLGEGYSPYAFASLALMIAGMVLVQPPHGLKSFPRNKGDKHSKNVSD
ncbi:DMT family transporter [Desulfobacterales bacterium HSG17]|nr:DMT family transporter [Desulfobacterales bacterium HSG17]